MPNKVKHSYKKYVLVKVADIGADGPIKLSRAAVKGLLNSDGFKKAMSGRIFKGKFEGKKAFSIDKVYVSGTSVLARMVPDNSLQGRALMKKMFTPEVRAVSFSAGSLKKEVVKFVEGRKVCPEGL